MGKLASVLFAYNGVNKWQKRLVEAGGKVVAVWGKEVAGHRFQLQVDQEESGTIQIVVAEVVDEDGVKLVDTKLGLKLSGRKRLADALAFMKQVMKYNDGKLVKATGDFVAYDELPYWSKVGS